VKNKIPGAWTTVALLWFVCFLNYADRQAIFSVFTLLKSQFGLSDVQLGIVASCFMWMYALFGPVAGWLADRISAKALIIGALTFWSAVTAATAVAHGYASLIVVRMLGGLGEAFYYPAAMSLIGAYHGPATRSRAMAFHQSSVYVGTIAGGSLSAVIAEQYGWRASFLFLGTCGIVLALVLAVLLREPAKDPEAAPRQLSANPFKDAGEALKRSATLKLIFVFIGANFVGVIFLTWLPTFLQRKFHLSLASAGFNATFYLQIASVVGVLIGGVLADMLVHKYSTGRQIVQGAGLLLGAPFIYFAGRTASEKIVLFCMVGFGLGKGIYDSNIWASLYDTVPVRLRGMATGLTNSLGWLGGGTAPLAVALAAARIGFSVSISISAAIYVLLGSVMLLSHRSRRPEEI
jgi:MFS family permease